MVNEKMRILGKEPSAIRTLFEEGKKLKEKFGDEKVFDYSIGNPSVPCPSSINESIVKAVNDIDSVSLHGYTSATGSFETRKAICDHLNKEYNADALPSLMYLTHGAAASLSIALKAVLNEKEEVIVFSPFFPEYKVYIENAGGVIKIVQSDLNTFLPDYKSFEESITSNTKAVIINSPNNPTGVVYKKEDIEKISDILYRKQIEFNHDIYLISDEPYRELIYSSIKYPFVSNYYSNTFIAYSFSKSLSLPGERIGYLLVSKKMNNSEDVYHAVCGAGRSLGYVCATSLFQYVIPHSLGKTSDISIYKSNRDILYKELTAYGYQLINPEGAFYIFMKALEDDSNHFSDIAKKFNLLLVPSDSFGIKGMVRISYCVSPKQINDSLPFFKALMDYYRKGN